MKQSDVFKMRSYRGRAVLAVLPMAIVAACGGAADDAAVSTSAPANTEPPPTTSAPEPVEEFDISMIEPSVVKIYAEGSFVDAASGYAYQAAGIGTGGVISGDGLVITNNHVVTGAALLRVEVPGVDGLVNARILGASECYDLAVIDLDGDGYQALEFSDQEPRPGLTVFAAGYPAADESTFEGTDYTLTSGIISSTSADGESGWASIDNVLEHDAQILAGNSGGPLVDAAGRIVGVNYAGWEDFDKNYAIARSEVDRVLDRLIAGEDVESIGINGEAIYDEYAGITGIWVSSVKPGSPADVAGVAGGDVITTLQGIAMGADGTMNDYCDVLRTYGDDATLSIEVLRYETSELLEGQINGEPLSLAFSFAQEFDDVVADAPSGGATESVGYSGYRTVSDDSGFVSVSVPNEWADVDGTYNDAIGGPSVWASTDLDAFAVSFDVPGVRVDVSSDGSLTPEAAAFEADYSSYCVDLGAESYEDGVYSGVLQLWGECGNSQSAVIIIGATDSSGEFTVRVEAIVVTDADLEALDEIINSFYVSM
jgi:serine protease Do